LILLDHKRIICQNLRRQENQLYKKKFYLHNKAITKIRISQDQKAHNKEEEKAPLASSRNLDMLRMLKRKCFTNLIEFLKIHLKQPTTEVPTLLLPMEVIVQGIVTLREKIKVFQEPVI
jgi:hypothetical protein